MPPDLEQKKDQTNSPWGEPAWYALRTRSRHERVVRDQLLGLKMEAFLPELETWSRRTDRRKKIQVPMFPGYLFVLSDLHPSTRLAMLQARGVVNIVSFNGVPAPADPEQINSLKILMRSELPLHPQDSLAAGDLVRITHGPLEDVVGRLVRRSSPRRLVVSVEIIQRAVCVELDDNLVIKELLTRT
ncbi:MAG: UpxY family transcription antiterminator [Proteobacteria bacterium]|nr:UpxY family transcription antiterminator [Pseudomonadota bacterium]MBU4384664.1 UpxY family transcription antiterminator [Pseudomonadota bacterium]MCG2766189.1 UpxY family transcription antiterminator [Desulfarculaceae bacterium]